MEQKPAVYTLAELPRKGKIAAITAMGFTIMRPLIIAGVAWQGRDAEQPWSWKHTLQAAAGYATDAEGQIVRRFDATTHLGIAADPIADKLAMGTHEFALCLRGEQSVADTSLRFFRDVAISAIRRGVKSETNGKASVGANNWGKLNTATRMIVNTAATSPLAERFPNILRFAQHATTALTLISGAITGKRLLQQTSSRKET